MNKEKVWENWSFEKEFLIDDAMNKYHIDDIRSLFFQRQLHQNILGNKFDIVCLKSVLEKRIQELDGEIVVSIVNKDKILREVRIAL
jgi:hypothetical protein